MRYRRWAPLSALAFLVLLVVAFLILGGDTPDSDASAAKVIAFYTAHRGQQQVAAFLLAIGTVCLLWFVTILREELRSRGSEPLATAALAGGIVMVTGFLGMASSHFAIADVAHKLQPAAAQALNAADGGGWMVSYAGGLFLAVTLTVAVLRLGFLPRVFAYLSGLLALVMLTPVGWLAWIALSIWLAAAGIVMSVRAARAPAPTRSLDAAPAAAS